MKHLLKVIFTCILMSCSFESSKETPKIQQTHLSLTRMSDGSGSIYYIVDNSNPDTVDVDGFVLEFFDVDKKNIKVFEDTADVHLLPMQKTIYVWSLKDCWECDSLIVTPYYK